MTRSQILVALLLCLGWLAAIAADPEAGIATISEPSPVAPAKTLGTGLLLEPDLPLDWYTREQFVKDMTTVGADKIQKKWKAPVVKLPPHEKIKSQAKAESNGKESAEGESAKSSDLKASADSAGLTLDEVKIYMGKVKEIFDRGAAIPVSDVGLISTQEDVIRRPMLNHIAAFENDVVRVYLLVQKTNEGKHWGYYSIVQDMTADPPRDYFGNIRDATVKIEATSCYKCHSSGPLAIHPARADLVLDAKLNAALNEYIAEQPRTQFHFPDDSPKPATGKPMALDACTDCHSEDGDRGELFQVHSHPIRIMVDYGYMPPGERLSSEDIAELKAWLDDKE